MNTNVVVFGGRLAGDVATREVGETSVSNMRVINNRYFTSKGEKRSEATAIDVEAWGVMSTAAARLGKGDECIIVGYMKQDSWEDKESGAKRSKLVLVANNIEYGRRAGDSSGGGDQESEGGREAEEERQENAEEVPF